MTTPTPPGDAARHLIDWRHPIMGRRTERVCARHYQDAVSHIAGHGQGHARSAAPGLRWYECPACGWHVSSYADGGYGPDCPWGVSPAVRERRLPNPATKEQRAAWRRIWTDYRASAASSVAGPAAGEAADERDPKPCPACGQQCTYDGWDHVHANGIGIGSCRAAAGPATPARPDDELRAALMEAENALNEMVSYVRVETPEATGTYDELKRVRAVARAALAGGSGR